MTFADGSGAVNSAQSGAMGEAWSDFYAMDFLVSQGLEPDSSAADVDRRPLRRRGTAGLHPVGGHRLFGCGSTAATCPGSGTAGPGGYTYGDFGQVSPFGPEVHADGEIWVQTLWDIRTALGSEVTLALVTRGMELSPPEPSFLDMRNAILEADQVAFGGAHADQLWQLFAHRGMGFFATAVDGSDVASRPGLQHAADVPRRLRHGDRHGRSTRRPASPVAGVNVVIAGHASGFGSDLVDATDGGGAFSIDDVPFHDYVVTVQSDRHEPVRGAGERERDRDPADRAHPRLGRPRGRCVAGAVHRPRLLAELRPVVRVERVAQHRMGIGRGELDGRHGHDGAEDQHREAAASRGHLGLRVRDERDVRRRPRGRGQGLRDPDPDEERPLERPPYHRSARCPSAS